MTNKKIDGYALGQTVEVKVTGRILHGLKSGQRDYIVLLDVPDQTAIYCLETSLAPAAGAA